jgi:hypothetical protein
MTFHPLEDEIITGFDASRPIGSDWKDSSLKALVVAAPATKGRFAREIIEQLAAGAGVTFGQVSGYRETRVQVGSAACEIKGRPAATVRQERAGVRDRASLNVVP